MTEPPARIEAEIVPRETLTSGQRHRMYRLGLLCVDKFMKERGFVSNAEPSHSVLSYEKDKVWIDIRLAKPAHIALVTSYPGYRYDPKKVTAKVTTLNDLLHCTIGIQIVVSTADAEGSRQPVFIPLPKTLPKPAHYVVENVLRSLAEACRSIPKVMDAFSDKAIRKAGQPEQLQLEDSFLPLLPE